MRKVSEKAACALIQEKNRVCSRNTKVEQGVVYLFGNAILKIRSQTIWISNAGWDTRTTRSRLREICLCLGVKINVNRVREDWQPLSEVL